MELLRDRRADFDAIGVQPVGISRDSPWCHIAWRQALDLNFGLLSDFNGEAVHGFDIGFQFRGFRDVAQRSAFLVDETGIIRNAWYYDTSDVPEVDAWLDAARALAAGPEVREHDEPGSKNEPFA
jgi:peroxiredoxin